MEDLKKFGYSNEEISKMTERTRRDTLAAMKIIQKDHQHKGIEHSGADWALRMDYVREIEKDVNSGAVQLPKDGLKIPVQTNSLTGYVAGRLEAEEKEILEWAGGNRTMAIEAIKEEIKAGNFLTENGIYNKDLLAHLERNEQKSITNAGEDAHKLAADEALCRPHKKRQEYYRTILETKGQDHLNKVLHEVRKRNEHAKTTGIER